MTVQFPLRVATGLYGKSSFKSSPKIWPILKNIALKLKHMWLLLKNLATFLHLDTLVTKKVEKANLICKDCLLHQCREDAVSVKGSPTRCSLLQGLNKTTVSAKT